MAFVGHRYTEVYFINPNTGEPKGSFTINKKILKGCPKKLLIGANAKYILLIDDKFNLAVQDIDKASSHDGFFKLQTDHLLDVQESCGAIKESGNMEINAIEATFNLKAKLAILTISTGGIQNLTIYDLSNNSIETSIPYLNVDV